LYLSHRYPVKCLQEREQSNLPAGGEPASFQEKPNTLKTGTSFITYNLLGHSPDLTYITCRLVE
jgi:hypothetical protein